VSEPLFLGFDAGGSKTVCVCGDLVTTLGRGEAGPANPGVAGVAGFRAAIATAATDALRGTGISDRGRLSESRVVAWIGLAGSESSVLGADLRKAARSALDTRRVWISHDGLLLLAAAGLKSGICVLAGTGSSVYGRSPLGHEVRVGGWGHLLGDEGSGYDIARHAFRAITQAADGRSPRTLLSDAIPNAVGVDSVDALRDRLYPAPPVAETARLARVVVELSQTDAVAAEIVAGAARQLAAAVRACRARLDAATHGRVAAEQAMDVVAGGGLMAGGSALLAGLAHELSRPDEAYRVMPLEVEPAVGALTLARDALARDGPDAEEEQLWEADEHVQQESKEKLR
jgi:N-acetylglucosamine kinase